MYYIVYKTTCLVNNKIYIGVHKTEDPNVFDGYIGCGISKNTLSYLIKHPRTPLQFALRKYGIANFQRETLYVFDREEDAYNKEAEIVNIKFINSDSTYNAVVGGRLGGVKTATPVFYFNTDGVLLGSFISSLEASKSVGCLRQTIDHAIKFKVLAGDYFWSREPIINITEYIYIPKNTYYVYNQNGEPIAENITKKEVLDIIDAIPNNFNRSINCLYPINGYFISKTKISDFKVILAPITGKKLNRYSLSGEYIDSFNTVKEAKLKLGISLNNISSALKSGKSCCGFYWTRSDNPEKKIKPRLRNIKKLVIVEHLDTKEVEVFESVTMASKKYKSVRYILRGRCVSPHNLKFSYKI